MSRIKFGGVVVLLLLSVVSLRAQSLKDLFSKESAKDAVTSVTGGLTLKGSSIVGEWDYVKPAVSLSSDSALKGVAGSIAMTQVEDKMAVYCSKVGITAGKFGFVFKSDGTFTSDVSGKSLGGSYSVDSASGKISLTYKAVKLVNIGTITAAATLTDDTLSMLFPLESLVKLLSAAAASSSFSELKALSTIAEKYKGINAGFSLSGKAVISGGDAVEEVEKAVDLLDKLF